MRSVVPVLTLLLLSLATAHAQVVVLPVSVDGYVTRTDPGDPFTLDTSGTEAFTAARIQNIAGQPEFEESRTLLEFNLAPIPVGATITGATLSVFVRSNSFFDPEGTRPVSFFGYSGDGVLTLADADAGVPIPILSGALDNGAVLLRTVGLDPTFVQDALDIGAFAGLNLRLPPSVMASIGIVTLENPDIPPFSAASLTVEYSPAIVNVAPEPSGLAYLGVGLTIAGWLRRRRWYLTGGYSGRSQ